MFEGYSKVILNLSLLILFAQSAISVYYHEERSCEGGVDVAWISSLVTRSMLSFVPFGDHPSSLCSLHGRLLHVHSLNLTLWAISIMDSTSKGPSGLLYGNNIDLGHFDQCVSSEAPHLNITGRYMMVTLRLHDQRMMVPPLPRPLLSNGTMSANHILQAEPRRGMKKRNVLSWGVCVPNSCSATDITFCLNKTLLSLIRHHKMDATIIINEKQVYDRLNPRISPTPSYIIWTIVAILSAIVCFATIMDSNTPESEKGTNSSNSGSRLAMFSLNRSFNKLTGENKDEFSVISLIKVFGMIGIIASHRAIIMMFGAMQNTYEPEQEMDKLFLKYVISLITLGLNAYITISGFLSFHKILKDISQGKEISVKRLIIRRWLRLTPSYVMVIAFVVFVLPGLEGGPLGQDGIINYSNCSKYYWTHLLYINNYVYPQHQCMITSWYVAVDMQLHLLGCLVGWVIWRNRRYGQWLFVVLLFAVLMAPGLAVLNDNLPGNYAVFFRSMENLMGTEEFTKTYFPSHPRAIHYMLGMLTAWIYLNHRDTLQPLSKKTLAIITSLLLLLFHVTLLSICTFQERAYDVMEHAVLAVCTNLGFTVPLCWIILIHITDVFSPVKCLLGSKNVYFLNQLSYAAMLVHTPLELYFVGANRTPSHFSFYAIVWMSIGDLFIAYSTAFLLFLLVEAPFSNLLQ